MSQKKLIIISIDALNAQDFDTIKNLSIFKRFIENGAYVRQVSSVYPSVTYTCHTSIITGHYPYAHAIYNNELVQPHQATAQDWHWYEHEIKSPTLFDYAKQKGLTVATLLWPVMGDADVEWNIPEIWAPDDTVSGFRLFWRHGTRNLFFPVTRYSYLLKGKEQPQLDDFTEAMTLYTLRHKQPDILAVHLTELDLIRHIHGLHSQEAHQSLRRINQRLEKVITLAQSMGTYANTNFVLLGDHGTHDFQYVISINRYLKDKGFLTTDEQGTINQWQAYGCSSGGSCQIHVKEGLDPKTKEAIQQALSDLVTSDSTPIKKLISKEEALNEYGLSGDFLCILEAKDQHVFRNAVYKNLITQRSEIPGCYRGDHGYLPSHPDMQSMLFLMGPNITKGAILPHCSLVDEGPTFAKLMGLKMEKTDGVILESLLKPS